VVVAETLTEVDRSRRIKGYPKSRARRTVPLPQLLVDVLAAHLATSPAKLAGPCGLEHIDGKACRAGQLVFRPAGSLSRHTWARSHFHSQVQAAGLEHVRVHDLRHTYTSWLVQNGVDLYEVSRVLGHASIVTTQRYAHLVPDDFSKVLGALDRGTSMGQTRRQ
jgi:integrase